MKTLEMGFRHTMIQRMPNYSTTPAKMSPPLPPAAKKTTENVPTPASQNVTDFSINRILGEKSEKYSAVKTKSTIAPALIKPTPTNPGGILDLSKTATINETSAAMEVNFPAYRPLNSYTNFFHSDFLAATKFYAQFFPNMFPAAYAASTAAQATTNIPMSFQKRFFAPYVLNTSQHQSTINTANNRDIISKPIPSTASDNLHPKTGVCTRIDCTGCLDYYKPYSAYKTATVSNSFPTTQTYYSKSKSTASVRLNSAATISLATVTNVNLTSSKSFKFGIPMETTSNVNSASSNSEEISYKCRICDKVFGCSETLQAHEKTHKSPRYECTDCGKGFSQLRNYKYHLSVHRGTKEFAAECPECGKTFNDKGYLSSHMKIHRNKKEYECPYCPKSFNQRVAFNMHVRIHTGVKPHKCCECGKRFSRKMLLKQHMRTHSGEKPYQCSVCGKSFADRSNMTLHHRLHSGIKPFNCPICPKAFTKKHHLKTHLNYHTGCKPYICPHPNCNQAFTQSSNMRTHAKKCQYRPLPAHPLTTPGQNVLSVPICTAANTLATTVTAVSNANLQASPFMPISGHVGSARHLTPLNSTFTAGIRMLANSTSATASTSSSSTATTLAFPPTQQPLLSTLRPFQ